MVPTASKSSRLAILLVACRDSTNANAVVTDTDQLRPAPLHIDVDAPGAGIETVLDQFLNHGRRSFDDLAGGDLIDELGRQCADGRHRPDGTRNGVSSQGGARAERKHESGPRCAVGAVR
jgi:hypothetical protein